jgi:hypothetical protein
MIEDLMSLKKQIEIMIETYKDLHPNDEEEIKENALRKVREGKYESTFRKKQRQEITESSQGSPTLCVYGDS